MQFLGEAAILSLLGGAAGVALVQAALLALRLCGCRITELRLCLSGLSLRYAGPLGAGRQALCALAGPLAGLFYAAAAARISRQGSIMTPLLATAPAIRHICSGVT